jgi:hypothetical protein
MSDNGGFNWEDVRESIRKDRGIYCERCGMAPWTELHHCLFHRMKNHKELDSIFNLMGVCSDCHPYCNSFETRRKFWRSQCNLYGHETMVEWYDGLNLLVKESFE